VDNCTRSHKTNAKSSINGLTPSQKAVNTLFDSCLVCPVPGNDYQ